MTNRTEQIKALAEWMGIKLSNYTYDGRLQERVETDTCFHDKELKWNPFTRIEDAWILANEVKKRYRIRGITIYSDRDGWCCEIGNNICESGTTPAAICKAVLALIESEGK